MNSDRCCVKQLAFAGLLSSVFLLNACASRLAPVDASTELERFTARAAIRYGDDGGSGKLHATRLSNGFRYEFYGALGQGHWRLTQTNSGAEFAAADGTIERAQSAEQLMLRRLGWQVPIEALWSWSSGQALPNDAAFDATFDDDGRLQRLQQLGFAVEFKEWSQDALGRWRPSRVTITRDKLRIRMKIASWTG
ncbi:MAG: hypothetical protein DHS20C11_15850 [Lysobacteraceae bacterium]|nr:MAG: hypothetical protein DHS20C11_15850 [Xanthomonadaceae bacterium]